MRSVKELIQKKIHIDQDIAILEKKVTDISEQGQQLIHSGHYDADEIRSAINKLVERFNGLQVYSAALLCQNEWFLGSTSPSAGYLGGIAKVAPTGIRRRC